MKAIEINNELLECLYLNEDKDTVAISLAEQLSQELQATQAKLDSLREYLNTWKDDTNGISRNMVREILLNKLEGKEQ